MLCKYYDEQKFQFAMSTLETDPYRAKERIEDYIQKYPGDYYARAYYVMLLVRIGLFQEAEDEYEYTLLNAQSDNFYNTDYKKIKAFKYNMAIAKLKLLAYHYQYQEMLELINNNRDVLTPKDVKYITYFCKIRLGIFDEETYTESYRFLQTYNYSEELLRKHVRKHMANTIENAQEQNDYIFNSDFPIDTVIDEVKKYIPSDRRFYPGYFDCIYYFKYDDCGMAENNKTNIFGVVCYYDTNNIITICPVANSEKLPYVDLNYLKYDQVAKTKVKTMSQIDKFNKRFNRI